VRSAEAATRFGIRERLSLANGIGPRQVDKVWADRRTLSAGAHEDLDLADGLADAFARPIALEELRLIWIAAAAGNPHDVLLGGGSGFTAPFAAANDTLRVRPGGVLVLTAPAGGQWTVDPDAAALRIANGGGSGPVTFDIVLIGSNGPDFDFTDDGNPLIAVLAQG